MFTIISKQFFSNNLNSKISFRSSSILYFCVNFSSKKSNADVIKYLNYENKVLFGPAAKKSKKKSLKSQSTDEETIRNCKTTNKISVNSKNQIDSERFWLIDQKKITASKIDPENRINKNDYNKMSTSIEFKTISESLNDIRNKSVKNKRSKVSTTATSTSPSQSSIKVASAAAAAPVKTESLTSPPSSILHKNYIPFNENELKNILRFPLIFDDDKNKNNENSITSEILSNPTTSLSSSSSSSLKLPSVGKILQSTMSENARNALINWKLRKISELGEDGFQNFQKELLQHGKLFHRTLQEYLTTFHVPTKIDKNIEGVWSSVQSALQSLKPETKLIEAPIQHPYLKYCGIVDYVSCIRSNLSVVEWKKSDKIKNSINLTYDAPLQLTAYLGALNFMKNHSNNQLENTNIKCGFVIIAYTNGEPAQIHYLDEIQLQKYWNLWLKRLQEYWIRYRDDTLPEPI